jgi:hypothetical protein
MIYLRRLYGIPINKLIDEDDLPILQKQIKSFLSLDTQNRTDKLTKLFKRKKNENVERLCEIICQLSLH